MTKRPFNILWLTMDHVTFHHYRHTAGARPVLNTYEALCREGISFSSCKSVHPLCMPARATMLTGVYPHRHGGINNDTHARPDAPLVCERLRDAGFDVGYFGKNHSGIESEQFCFEGFFPSGYGNPYLTPEYRAYLDRQGLDHPLFEQEWSQQTADTSAFPNGTYDLTREDNFNRYCSGYLSTPGPVHEVDFLADAALRWLDGRQDKTRPFVLRVDTWGPHHAYQVPLAYKDLIPPEEICEYPSYSHPYEKDKPAFAGEFLRDFHARSRSLRSWADWQPVMARAYEQYSYIDAAFGRLIDAVRRAGYGEDTCILFTADHGDAIASHGGMFDKCGDMQEELMDIPMAIYVPGMTGGQCVDSLTSNLDVVPTILDMAGLPVPDGMDGQSLLALARQQVPAREQLMCEHYGHFRVHLQQRTLYWKHYKYTATETAPHELYDLEADPFEMHNLIHSPEAGDLLKEMQRRLLAEMELHQDDSPLMEVLRTRCGA